MYWKFSIKAERSKIVGDFKNICLSNWEVSEKNDSRKNCEN
jgi:hypothetical protein